MQVAGFVRVINAIWVCFFVKNYLEMIFFYTFAPSKTTKNY